MIEVIAEETYSGEFEARPIYTCDLCGEIIENDNPEEIDGKHYCSDCLTMITGMEG